MEKGYGRGKEVDEGRDGKELVDGRKGRKGKSTELLGKVGEEASG